MKKLILCLSLVLSLNSLCVYAQENEVNTDEEYTSEYVVLNESIENGTSPLYSVEQGKVVYYNGTFHPTLTAALKAAYISSPSDNANIYCMKDTNVGSMTHGHVGDDITIYGNGAYISSGERDLEIDTYSYDRVTGNQTSNNQSDLSKDITVNVYDLEGIAAWGQRHTGYTINLNFKDCDAMGRVYFTGTTGDINISLENCTFDGTGQSVHGTTLTANKDTTIYSNANGTITINNCTFNNIDVGLNLNHKMIGIQNINIINTTFHNCGLGSDSNKTYAAPVRVVTVEGSESNLSISGGAFTYDSGNTNVNGDILLGDGRYNASSVQGKTTLAMQSTSANVTVQQSGYYTETGSVSNPDNSTTTVVDHNQIVKPDYDNHFVVEEVLPDPKPVVSTEVSVDTESTYDDGGPFTHDECGNVYDRWGNEIYHAPVCISPVSTTSGYQLVNTSVQ